MAIPSFQTIFSPPQIGDGNVDVANDDGSTNALDSGDTFSVTFTGIYGDLPLLTPRPASRATVESVTRGESFN